jgi:hypothetical protein
VGHAFEVSLPSRPLAHKKFQQAVEEGLGPCFDGLLSMKDGPTERGKKIIPRWDQEWGCNPHFSFIPPSAYIACSRSFDVGRIVEQHGEFYTSVPKLGETRRAFVSRVQGRSCVVGWEQH